LPEMAGFRSALLTQRFDEINLAFLARRIIWSLLIVASRRLPLAYLPRALHETHPAHRPRQPAGLVT
jgi:hypothetical protein